MSEEGTKYETALYIAKQVYFGNSTPRGLLGIPCHDYLYTLKINLTWKQKVKLRK